MKDYLYKKNEEFQEKINCLKRQRGDDKNDGNGENQLKKVKVGDQDVYQMEIKFIRYGARLSL